MFDIGFWELVIVAVAALIVLGPERLPHALRSIGQTIAKMRVMASSVRTEVEKELQLSDLKGTLGQTLKDSGLSTLSQELAGLKSDIMQPMRHIQSSLTDAVTPVNDVALAARASLAELEADYRANRIHTDNDYYMPDLSDVSDTDDDNGLMTMPPSSSNSFQVLYKQWQQRLKELNRLPTAQQAYTQALILEQAHRMHYQEHEIIEIAIRRQIQLNQPSDLRRDIV